MPIEMPRGLPFSVDTWTQASKRKRHHFLTHAHKDHLQGISAHASYPIYTTRVTKSLLLLNSLPPNQIDESLFVEIEVGETVVVNDPDGNFSVTAFDANHCPGAVMWLFEGEFGNILHTGDCRLSPDCVQNLPLKYMTKKANGTIFCLDYLFLDCTFGRSSLKIPSKQSAIQQVINCIWKHPNAPVVYLACDMLGQEDILVEVSRTFGSKIYVDKTKSTECFQALLLTVPDVLSEDASSRFQVCEGFPRLYERTSAKLAEARASVQPEPLFIRPSTQWYACDDSSETERQRKARLSEAERDDFGVWHVCYSMHSSREELEWGLQLLQPKWVISTTPPCRAMELNYVRNHCFKTQITDDDPLWKLLKVGTERSASLPVSSVSQVKVYCSSSTSVVSVATPTSAECDQLQVKKLPSLGDMTPLTSIRPITLFGRARLGLQDLTKLDEGMRINSAVDNTKVVLSMQENAVAEEGVPFKEVTIAGQVPSLQENHAAHIHLEKPKHEVGVERDASYIGSSKIYSASLRNLYRSMNVPVPRPLPSLMELMEVSKRAKIGS